MNLKTAIGAVGVAALMASGAAAKNLDMQSIYPGSLPLLGDGGVAVTKRIETLTGGALKIKFREPGEIVGGGSEIWNAVSSGAVDAAWYSPGFAEGVIPSAALFTAVPFGPDVKEYTSWWYYGGGKELWAELTVGPHNVHTELCAILAPEASGWFKEEIKSPADLKGKKMRIFGLGAAVMAKLGVKAQSMSVADTMTALNLKTIDAAEISFPAIDNRLGMYEHAKHYYFPGWHQQTSLIVMLFNKDVWDGLKEAERAAVKETCAANVALSSARGEAMQFGPLKEMIEKHGVKVHKWSDEMLAVFKEKWLEVVKEKSAADPSFKRAWEHLQAFRAQYKKWAELGYVK